MMSFALILVILSAVTGVGYLVDRLFWRDKRPENKLLNWSLEFCRSFFSVFFIVLLLRSFLVEPFRIPSGSLEPTLTIGDFVAVNKFIYGIRIPVIEKKVLPVRNPKVGEVAVFRWPPAPSYDYIKRVIGVGGDKISYHKKRLTINGVEVKQSFVEYTIDESSGASVAKYKEILNGVEHDIYIRPGAPAHDFDITVPEGQYFMMGDNRDDSADSRYWGFVPDSYLRGKAFFVWFSWDVKTLTLHWNQLGWIK